MPFLISSTKRLRGEMLPLWGGRIPRARTSVPGTVGVSGQTAVCTSFSVGAAPVQGELHKAFPGTNVQLLLQTKQSQRIRNITQAAVKKFPFLNSTQQLISATRSRSALVQHKDEQPLRSLECWCELRNIETDRIL